MERISRHLNSLEKPLRGWCCIGFAQELCMRPIDSLTFLQMLLKQQTEQRQLGEANSQEDA